MSRPSSKGNDNGVGIRETLIESGSLHDGGSGGRVRQHLEIVANHIVAATTSVATSTAAVTAGEPRAMARQTQSLTYHSSVTGDSTTVDTSRNVTTMMFPATMTMT